MLWYKAWCETRWRFLAGFVVLTFSACGTVLAYPRVMELLRTAPQIQASGIIGREIREAIEAARDYRGYIWSQAFRQNLIQMWTLFAVMIGSGPVFGQASGGGTLLTLSLPVSRRRLVGIRAACGLAELAVLALAPTLLIPTLSPIVGRSYGVGDALVHAGCLAVAGSTFFCLAFFFSTLTNDVWRPLLAACGIAIAISIAGQVAPGLACYSIFPVMNGEVYFRSGSLPWLGLIASAAASMLLLYGAAANAARQDF